MEKLRTRTTNNFVSNLCKTNSPFEKKFEGNRKLQTKRKINRNSYNSRQRKFLRLSETDRQQFFAESIVEKLGLVKLKVKRNKLEFDISQLIADVKKSINYEKTEKKPVANNAYNSLWHRAKTKFNL